MDNDRVRALRREVWMLRILLGGVVVAGMVTGLIAQAPPQNQNAPITTTALTVVDATGRTRIRLWVDNDRPRVEVVEQGGKTIDLVPAPQMRPLSLR